MLKKNNDDLRLFFEGKKDELLGHIKTAVQNKILANNKYKSDVSKF